MGFFDKLKQSLKKTSNETFGKIKKLLSFSKIDEEVLEQLEELLIMGDVGIETTEKIILQMKERGKEFSSPEEALEKILTEILSSSEEPLDQKPEEKPIVISVIGVNGAGKTTSIGKLAKYFKSMDLEVVVAAADTFRAAAIDQLKVWAKERAEVTIISSIPGGDAGAVVYDAVNHALSKKKDIVLIDTAGRLHTKNNLMEELKKIHNVVKKILPSAPQEVLLVLDATTGQNGLIQAEKFSEAVGVTGIILTKLDGTAKGGIALAIKERLNIPIKYIGVGEGIEDLKPFNPEEYVKALMQGE